jgi:hypothetical protein
VPVPGLTSRGTTSIFARSQYIAWPITLAAALAAPSGLLAASPAGAQQPPAAGEQPDEVAPPEAEAGQEAGGPVAEEAKGQDLVEPQPVAEPEPAAEQPPVETAPPAAAVEPAAEAKKELPKRIGPARIETGSGHLDLAFAFQILGTVVIEDTRDKYDTTFGVEPRRFRFYPRGAFLEDRFRFGVQLSTTPTALEILDWWMDGRILEQLQVRLGQYKVPFTRYRQQSFSKCLLVDWGNVTRPFGAERQIGLMLHNGDARPQWQYAVGLFNGQNSRRAHGVGPADVYAVPLTNPSDLRAPGLLEDRWHPELVFRLQHNSHDIDTLVPTDGRGGDLRHALALSASWDNLPDDAELTTRNDLFRLAPEILLKAYGVAFIGVVYVGVEKTAMNEKTRLGTLGWLAELAYRFHPTWELAARFSRVDFMKALRDDARDHAAAQIAAAAGTDEEQAVTDRYREAGASKATQELSLGLNVYIVESDLKLQTDLVLLSDYLDDDTRNDYRWRTQMQLAF